MIIISKKIGQLCNRLFLYANIISIGIEKGRKVYNPTFGDYAHYFEGTHQNLFLTYPDTKKGNPYRIKGFYYSFSRIISFLPFFKRYTTIKENIVYRVFKKLGYVNNNVNFSEKSIYFDQNEYQAKRKELLKSKVLFLSGFLYFNTSGMKKYQEELKAFFTPRSKYRKVVDDQISNLRNDSDVIVGLHIRRGDYRYYREGKFFYSDKIYCRVLEEVAQIFSGKKVIFLICSDEQIDSRSFDSFDIHIAGRSEIEDLYALSCCDYLLGPPSTFSKWASFFGSVPLYEIRDQKANISIDDFKIRYNHY